MLHNRIKDIQKTYWQISHQANQSIIDYVKDRWHYRLLHLADTPETQELKNQVNTGQL